MVTGVQLATLGLNPDEFNDLSPEELSAVESILGEISKGNTDQYDELYYTDYEEIPVDFITFINDPRYLGNSTKGGQLVYDFWKKEGTRIVNGDEVEVALSGAIGTGKSTAACLMLAYILYKNMCLRNPQEFFNLRPGSKITIALLNNTLASSYGVGFDTLQSFLCDSPWFLEHGTVSGRTDETKHYIPDKGFQIIVGSRIQHTLGLNVIAALIDELNFAPGQDAAYTKSKIMSIYANIRQRMNSRFTVQGKNYGKLFLVSSKATEYSFLEAYIADQLRKGYPIYVVDKPRWEVKPFMYSGKTFKVAVGNKYLPSRIVPDNLSPDELDEYCKGLESQGLKIIDVPIEEKQSFDQDIDRALQDAAGIATAAVTKAFNSQKVLEATSDTYMNPFTNEIISLGMNDSLQLKDFFDTSRIPDFIYGCPVFIHLDASLSGDRTGLAGTAILGARQSVNTFAEEDEDKIVDELVCQEVFHVGIQPPTDSEISFEKTRQFIYYLKDEVGLNIKLVTTDGFQSDDTRQILSTRGFEVGYTSLDRTPVGYDGLRSALYDKRMLLLSGGPKLFEELTELERDNMSRKYDHNAYNSKDISDALAGSHADAMQYKQEYMFFHSDAIDYEGFNVKDNSEEKMKQEFISSTSQVKAPTTVSSKPQWTDSDIMEQVEHSQVSKPSKKFTMDDVADIFASIDGGSDDILFL